jgi:FkbM family methyltransferase
MEHRFFPQLLWQSRYHLLTLANSPRLFPRTAARVLDRLLAPLFRFALSGNPLIRAKVWGSFLYMQADHHLPAIVAGNPLWLHPLLDTVAALELSTVQVVDVGANIGDSVALLEAKLPGVCRYLCIEPDDSFYECCRLNTAANERVTLLKCFVGDTGPCGVAIDHGAPGTATTQILGGGAEDTGSAQRALTLDEVCAGLSTVDVIKVDTDGFDFKVIRSAAGILRKHHPLLFFEWAPTLWEAQREDSLAVFDFLATLEYSHFVFFADNGFFYASVAMPDTLTIASLRMASLARAGIDNLFFDVLAGSAQICQRAVDLNIAAIKNLVRTVPAWHRFKPAYWQ